MNTRIERDVKIQLFWCLEKRATYCIADRQLVRISATTSLRGISIYNNGTEDRPTKQFCLWVCHQHDFIPCQFGSASTAWL